MTQRQLRSVYAAGDVTEERWKTVYEAWCQRIADQRSAEELIAHFREHVWEHFLRHSHEGQLSMDVWMVGVLNFMHILQKKVPHITVADMLFKLCRHHVHTPGGPEPPFDLDDFLARYDGPIKKFHRETCPV